MIFIPLTPFFDETIPARVDPIDTLSQTAGVHQALAISSHPFKAVIQIGAPLIPNITSAAVRAQLQCSRISWTALEILQTIFQPIRRFRQIPPPPDLTVRHMTYDERILKNFFRIGLLIGPTTQHVSSTTLSQQSLHIQFPPRHPSIPKERQSDPLQ